MSPTTPHLASITFDCTDALAVGPLLVGRPRPARARRRHQRLRPLAGEPAWSFMSVPEPKTAKNRVHVDLDVADLAGRGRPPRRPRRHPRRRLRGVRLPLDHARRPRGQRVRRRRGGLTAPADAGPGLSRVRPVAGVSEGPAVKLLHTSDWHVGKAIRGASRADEHRAVLDEIAGDRRGRGRRRRRRRRRPVRHVDAVAGVRGDRLPGPARPRRHRAPTVAVIAGNHDNARRLRAVAPLLELGNVHLVTEPTRPDDGGVLALTTARRHRRAHRHAAVRVQAGHRARRRPDGRRGVRERPALQRPAAPADRGAVRAASTRTRSTSSSPTRSCSAPSPAAASGRPTSSTSTPSRRRRSPPRSATAPSATCTGRSASRPGRRCTTADRRCSSTSARASSPSRSTSSRSSRACPPTSAPVRLTAGRPLRTVDRHARRARRARRRRRSVAARRRARAAPGRAGRRRPPSCSGRGVVDVRIDAPMPRRPPGAATTTTAAARRSCSTSTSRARASTTTGSGRCSPTCSTRRSTP